MIKIKSAIGIDKIRKSCEIVAQTLKLLKKYLQPGITTIKLDKIAYDFIIKKGAIPAFLGYRGYPATICVAINEVVVHGIPNNRKLKEGDIIGIDVGVKFNGYYGDAAITVGIGEVSKNAKRLIDTTKLALYRGIEKCIKGNHLSDISHAIQTTAEENGFNVVRNFVGHGIGTELHEDPQILNYGPPNMGPILKSGMVLAIEPMVNEGTYEVEIMDDKWTVLTKDRRLSAHFEHTVAITENGPLILTKLNGNYS
jgi:methionyl aminopeptidase